MGCFSKPKKDVRLGVSQFVLQTQNVILALLINDEPDPGGGYLHPIHYLYGYVLPNGVVILKLLI